MAGSSFRRSQICLSRSRSLMPPGCSCSTSTACSLASVHSPSPQREPKRLSPLARSRSRTMLATFTPSFLRHLAFYIALIKDLVRFAQDLGRRLVFGISSMITSHFPSLLFVISLPAQNGQRVLVPRILVGLDRTHVLRSSAATCSRVTGWCSNTKRRTRSTLLDAVLLTILVLFCAQTRSPHAGRTAYYK